MTQEVPQNAGSAAPAPRVSLHARVVEWAQHAWRPAGTLVAIVLTLFLGWGVVSGKHGLSAWQHQRAQEKLLKQEIQDLQQENSRLRNHIQRLKSDPDAIEHQAREELHYARPGEVIYTLPAPPQAQAQTQQQGNSK